MYYPKTLEEVINLALSLERYTNRNNFKLQKLTPQLEELKKIDKRNIQIIEKPQIVYQQHRGFCYDQSFLIKAWLDNLSIKNNVYYSCTNNVEKLKNSYIYTPKFISHVLLVYELDNKFKWLEWSWVAQIHNCYNENTQEEVLNKYKVMAENSWHMPIILTKITDIDVGILRVDFLNKALNKPHIFG